MSRPLQLTPWRQQLASRFPELSASVIAVLALYSFGLLLAHVCGLSTVALFLARYLGRPRNSLRKRLAEFYKEAPAKSGVRQGQKRQDFDVTTCFGPLLRWVLSLWSGRHLPLALDVTNLGDRFHVLCISVVVRGVGLPVAWKVLPGGVPDPWNPQWFQLLRRLRAAVPDDWTVLVLSDRGLESAEWFRFLVALGWHPLMRVKKGGKFRPHGWGRFYYLGELLRQPGAGLALTGRAYTGEQLGCTLLARWEEGYAEPWLLLTDLAPEAASAVWYGLRAWSEQGFKLLKGGGWDWHKTRMADPGRVERRWLVLAVATLWVVALGAEDEAGEQARAEQQRLTRQLSDSAEATRARLEWEQQRRQAQQQAQQARQAREQQRAAARQAARAAAGKKDRAARPKKKPERKRGGAGRPHRVDRRGLALWQALWERGESRLPQHLYPQPWPAPVHSASTLTEQEFVARLTYP